MDGHPSGSDDHGPAGAGTDPAAEPFDDHRPGGRRPPSLRWGRLRDRWVPESLQSVRWDPGRRGSILLTLVAAVGAVVAAVGVWSSPPEPVAATMAGAAVAPLLAPASSEPTAVASAATMTEAPMTIVVAVTGAVLRPGVVTVPAGARVADAVAAAGGVTDGTDFTGLNLAAKLADGDSVVVGGTGQGLQAAAGAAPAGDGAAGGLVNLNTADQATLETLPGVGPVMAANILAWRTDNGSFTSVDQLQEITGIGPSRFATLAPLVTV